MHGQERTQRRQQLSRHKVEKWCTFRQRKATEAVFFASCGVANIGNASDLLFNKLVKSITILFVFKCQYEVGAIVVVEVCFCVL